MKSVDLNCDMGEGCGNDRDLMDFVSSANIACGFHAGDAATMRRTVDIAIEKGVVIGAHPSFPDRGNFGRTAMKLPVRTVFEIVGEQILALKEICDRSGGHLRHVKPHGALYNQAARDPELAHTIAAAVKSIDKDLILFGLSGSSSIDEAEKIGLRTASEVFSDRTYATDGMLTPRTQPNALITDADAAVAQVLQMVIQQTVTATNGATVAVRSDTICIHGDGVRALEFTEIIHRSLAANGIAIKAIYG
ncbi:MAG: 5-oxoprolinase subunit PxpA [Pyrinomonadaceae bacterium]